jgi:hypothetical protein
LPMPNFGRCRIKHKQSLRFDDTAGIAPTHNPQNS